MTLRNVACLALVATITTACVCAMRYSSHGVNLMSAKSSTRQDGTYVADLRRDFGYDECTLANDQNWITVRTLYRSEVLSNVQVPPWAVLPPSGGAIASCTTIVAGWPMRCLRGFRVDILDTGVGNEVGMIHIGNRRVPVLPIPLGLIVDFMLYAVLIGSVGRVLTKYRRRFRARRGLCKYCGYDVRQGEGRPCPECGEVILHTRPVQILGHAADQP